MTAKSKYSTQLTTYQSLQVGSIQHGELSQGTLFYEACGKPEKAGEWRAKLPHTETVDEGE